MKYLIRDIKAYIHYLVENKPYYKEVLIINHNDTSQICRINNTKTFLICKVMERFVNSVKNRYKLLQLVRLLVEYYIVKRVAKYESKMRLNPGRK